jgi:serine/threonine protein kinase
MLQKQPELRISAAEALKHSYFTDSDDKIYVPKILMKQSGSCPVELISNENEAAVKFITITAKADKKESIVRTYDRSTIKKKL